MSGVKMGWVERREGWRGRVGRTGRRERDFKGSQAVPQLRSLGPYLPCPP